MHTHPHTWCRCNNIRVGRDFKGWLTFGYVSACLWVQLGPLALCTPPLKSVCYTHTHMTPLLHPARICFTLRGLSELCSIYGRVRSQMLLSLVCLRAGHLLAVWVMVCHAVAWCACGLAEPPVFSSGLHAAHLCSEHKQWLWTTLITTVTRCQRDRWRCCQHSTLMTS